MSFLINFCFNSCTDPFCLALQLQAQCLQRLALRSKHDSLSSFFSLCYRFYHVSDVDSVFDSVVLDCVCF